MNIQDKIRVLFSPLDVITVERDFEKLIPKGSEPDVFAECLDFAQMILGAGEHPDRNPTWWKTFQGEPVVITSKTWRDGIANLLRLTSSHEVKEVDNNFDHLLVGVKLEVLAINARDLPEAAFKGVKCISAKTAVGDFPIVEE